VRVAFEPLMKSLRGANYITRAKKQSLTRWQSERNPMLPEQRFATPVIGSAYRLYTKLFTLAMVLSIFAYGLQVFLNRKEPVASSVVSLMVGACVVLAVTTWYIVTAKTTIDSKGIRQDWFFKKDFSWHEIGRVKFLRLPFSSRLVILAARGPFKAVNSGSKELDAAFKYLEDFYTGKSL
jgi:hypothetical protein